MTTASENNNTTPPFDFLFKLLLIGNSGVGKSSLMTRYCDDTFQANYISTIGVDLKIRTLVLHDVPRPGQTITVKLQIWDTAGQERFKTIVRSYYRGAHAVLFVFDVTDRQSFDALPGWVCEADSHNNNDDQQERKQARLLIGNKTDLASKYAGPRRMVTKEEAQLFAGRRGMDYIETSALTNSNVEEAFLRLTTKLVQQSCFVSADDNNSGRQRKHSNISAGVSLRDAEGTGKRHRRDCCSS